MLTESFKAFCLALAQQLFGKKVELLPVMLP
jgi:hypothetical protein